MKDTGKTIRGVKVYTDPDVPPNQMFLLNDFKNLPPRRNGIITGLYEPQKDYGFLRRLKWKLWDSV